MRRLLAAAAASCVFLACASGGSGLTPPDIEFVQLSGPADQSYTPGEIEVQYGMRIENRATVPITLRQVQVQSMGLGGSYRLQPGTYHFQREIAANEAQDVTFWAKAIAGGDAFAADANAPITIRATAYFDSPSGSFRRVFTKVLAQQ